MKILELERMFQDGNALVPVTAAGQPVGFIIDKSQDEDEGPELVRNGIFNASTTYWSDTGNSTYSVNLNTLTLSSGELTQAIASAVPGKLYLLEANVTATPSATVIKLGTTSGSSDIVAVSADAATTSIHQHFVPDTTSVHVSLVNEVDVDAAIADLFASGEDGAWYDPSDLTTLFEDSFGTIPVTGAGQPVGLMLDKSKGLELGEELLQDGEFNNSSSWGQSGSWVVQNGRAEKLGLSDSYLSPIPSVVGHAGKFYQVSFDVIQYTKFDGFRVNYGGTYKYIPLSVGRLSVIINPQVSSNITFTCVHTGTIIIDNVSIRELAGNHATQATSTARPVLQNSGGLWYLDFDGVDDGLIWTIPEKTTSMGAFTGWTINKSSGVFLFGNGPNKGTVIWDNGTQYTLIHSEAGTPTMRIDGVDYSPSSRVEIRDLVYTNSAQVLSVESLNLTSWSTISFANYGNIYNVQGKLFGLLIRDALTTEERGLVEYYLSTKSGVAGIPSPYPAYAFDNISVKEVLGYHARQTTSTARPILAQTNGYYYLDFDGVDDRLLLTLPADIVGTAVISDVLGTAAYGVDIPSGTFAIGTNSPSVNYSFAKDLLGIFARNNALTEEELNTTFQYFIQGGASAVSSNAYQGVTNLGDFWRNADWITEFPLIDTTSATSFYASWYRCYNLISFPQVDSANVTNMRSSWFDCTSLTSFPLIDSSQVINIGYTWMNCGSLSSFPLLDTGSVTSMERAWSNCVNLSSFPQIDTSQVLNLVDAWYNCRSLSSFPLIDTGSVTSMSQTWYGCYNLTSFPLLDTNTVFGFFSAWRNCYALSSFPAIDISKGGSLYGAWRDCINLSSFPEVSADSAYDLRYTWHGCTSLESFPSGVFDNTSGTVDFSLTFNNTKLNSQSVDNVLLSINNANTASGTLELSIGSMQAPGVGGTYAKHRLQSRDWTVNTKPVSDDVIVSSIFYTGQYGTWYDVNDLSTLYQDSIGYTPVTAAGQPVGLMLDKSQGLELGEEIFPEDILDNSGYWSFDPTKWTVISGQLIAAPSANTYIDYTFNSSSLQEGKFYRIEYDLSGDPGCIWGPYIDGAKLNQHGLGSGHYTYTYRKSTADLGFRFLARSSPLEAVITNLTIKELPGNHAYQNTSTARPVLQGSAGDYHLYFDRIDDRLLVDVSGFNGTAYIPSEKGSVAYGVAIPSGTYTIGTNNITQMYTPAYEILGGVITDTPMISPEIGALDNYFAARGGGPYGASAYGGLTSLYQYWRDANWITEFPLIDTSQVTNLGYAWYECRSLKSFPAINTSSVTNLLRAWSWCISLSSFPLIDTSQVTTMQDTWLNCQSLSSFPLIDTSQVTNMIGTWYNCYNLTSFPLIDTSQATVMADTWAYCQGLSSFPLIDTNQVTNMQNAWLECRNLTSFPAINTSAVTNLYRTWRYCNSLSSFPLIDTSQVTNFEGTWNNCFNLSTFPGINTSAATRMVSTWGTCSSLTEFPTIDTGQVTSMLGTWANCSNLSSFPLIDTKNVTTMQYSWQNCTKLASFPAINTSAVTNFALTWWNCTSLSSFPAIDCRSATDIGTAWKACTNLEHFPAGVFDNTSGTTNFAETFYATKLNTQSIDNVLVSVNNANTSNGTIRLNTGSTQPPSYWGIAASGALEDRGWDVVTKDPTAEAELDATIAPLFFSGDVGGWYDPSDFDTMFEDSYGTIPVTGAGQPVGLILDKSRGLQLGNELLPDPTFTSINNFTLEGSPTTAEIDSNGDLHIIGNHNEGVRFNLNIPIGEWYESRVVCKCASGTIKLEIGYAQALLIGANSTTASDFTEFVLRVRKTTGQNYIVITGVGALSEFWVRSQSLRPLAGNHAYQQTSTARPVLQVNASGDYYLYSDFIDDKLVANIPNVDGTLVIATAEGVVAYGAALSGLYGLNLNNPLGLSNYAYQRYLYGSVLHDGALDSNQVNNLYSYYATKGITLSGSQAFGNTTSVGSFWRDAKWLTEMPLIDTSKVTGLNFVAAWAGASNMRSFPALNTSGATSLSLTWYYCSTLSSFPWIDTSQVTTMSRAWPGCFGLSSFPLIDTSQVTNMQEAWQNCYGLTSFPAINTSSATNMSRAWQSCNSLSSFPLINTESVTSLQETWMGCSNLTEFPLINTSATTNMNSSWRECISLSSFPLIDTSQVTILAYTWHNCNSLSSFPLIDTSQVTTMDSAWRYCSNLSSFPLIDTSQVTNMNGAWEYNYGLSSFPLIDTTQVTSLNYTWRICNSLQTFPQINTSSTTSMVATWLGCIDLSSFPLIDTSQVSNMAYTWDGCASLSSFPQIDCRTATNLYRTWYYCTSLEVFPSGVFDNTSGTTDFSTTFAGTKLNTQSIDNVLLSVNKANTSDGTITLNSTNMQTPGIGGTYAKHQLENRGWTVNTKAVTNDVVVSSVFYEGESAWYDVNDLTTLYQATNMIPVTGAGDPVGLMLDKSQGLVLGEELISNGAFDADTNWTKGAGWSISGGTANHAAGVAGGLDQAVVVTAGKWYRFTVDATAAGGSWALELRGGTTTSVGVGLGSGSFTFTVQAGDGNNLLRVYAGTFTDLTVDNISVKELPGNHAYQQTSTARPVLQGSAGDYYLDFDGVDDRLLVDSPGFTGTAYIADELGSAAYGVSIPSGTYTIGTNTSAVNYSFAKDIVGEVLLDRPLLDPELTALQTYFDDLGAGPYGASAYGGLTSLYQYWRNADWITEFPLIDSSQVTNLISTWSYCTNLSSFPLIDTNQVTNLQETWVFCENLLSFPAINTSNNLSLNSTWRNCFVLSSFPLIDTSKTTNFSQAWMSCYSLSSFPAINTSSATTLYRAWLSCSSLSSFPVIDTSQVTNMNSTWQGCTSLSSFPVIDTSQVTNMNSTWQGCTSLSSFPLIDTSQVTSMQYTWQSCTSLSSFPLIDTGLVINFTQAWLGCNNLTSFPAINTSSATNLFRTWSSCTNLSTFPQIDTGSVTNLTQTWSSCNNLSSFPLIDTGSVTSLSNTWYQCYALTSFPAINTSAVTDFGQAWRQCQSLSSFPQIDCRSATNLFNTWYACTSLEVFPAGVFDNTSGTTDFSNTFSTTKLNTQSVDNVLVSVNNADTSSGTLTLNFTNMQPPSYWGIVASGLLADRGWNVTTKTPTTEALTDSTIASLFFSGDEGAWYDPSDFDTMFEDYRGTIPVTGTSQPVGLILDKSKGLQLGNELVVGGEFNVSSDWVVAPEFPLSDINVSGGVLTCTRNSTYSEARSASAITLEIGKTYVISVDVLDHNGNYWILLASSPTDDNPGRIGLDNKAGTGTKRFQFTATYSTAYVYIACDKNNGNYLVVDNMSIRELPGNHAYQQTSTARPTLEVDDITGKYYLNFDGVDDYLLSNNVDYTSKSAFSTFGGVAADSFTGPPSLWSHGQDYGFAGRWVMQAAYRGIVRDSSNTNRVPEDGITAVTGTNYVVGLTGEFGVTDWTFRIDGADGTSVSSVATNMRNEPFYMGYYAGGVSWLNGRIYGMMVIPRVLNSTEIATVESYMAAKSGVTL